MDIETLKNNLKKSSFKDWLSPNALDYIKLCLEEIENLLFKTRKLNQEIEQLKKKIKNLEDDNRKSSLELQRRNQR